VFDVGAARPQVAVKLLTAPAPRRPERHGLLALPGWLQEGQHLDGVGFPICRLDVDEWAIVGAQAVEVRWHEPTPDRDVPVERRLAQRAGGVVVAAFDSRGHAPDHGRDMSEGQTDPHIARNRQGRLWEHSGTNPRHRHFMPSASESERKSTTRKKKAGGDQSRKENEDYRHMFYVR
jgi:hypothetical protein